MFTKKRDITAELKALVAATESLPRGSLVTHEEIEKATGMPKEHPSRTTIIKKWKKYHSVNRGITIMPSVPSGVGYRLLTVEEQLKVQPVKYRSQAVKKINKAAECLGSIGDGELDESGAALRSAMLGQLSEMKEKEKAQRAMLSTWLSSPKALPRITN